MRLEVILNNNHYTTLTLAINFLVALRLQEQQWQPEMVTLIQSVSQAPSPTESNNLEGWDVHIVLDNIIICYITFFVKEQKNRCIGPTGYLMVC